MKYVIAAKDASVLERLSQRVRKRAARVRKPHEVGVCVCVCARRGKEYSYGDI